MPRPTPVNGSHVTAWPTAVLLLLIAAGYAWLAWLSTGHTPQYVLGIIERAPLLSSADDAYRWFIARGAFLGADPWAWNYMLPGALLLDGLVALLADGNLFAGRVLHIVPAMLALWLVHASGLQLGLGRLPVLLSVLVVALMPLYAFVAISFYGETWLVLFCAASLYAFVRGNLVACALLASLMPLLRVEGIFLLAPLALFFLRQRQWRPLALLMLPGTLHFLSLFLLLENIGDYFTWRSMFRETLAVMPHAGDLLYRNFFLSTINPLWTLPGLAAFALPRLRPLWPLWSGTLLWLAYLSLSVYLGKAAWESRYLVPLLPLLALGWAALAAALLQRAHRHLRLAQAGLCVLFLGIVVENFFQLDPYKTLYADGRRWPVAGMPVAVDRFFILPPSEQAYRAQMVAAIGKFIAGNPEIDRLVVYDDLILRSLEPRRLPPRVRVSLAPFSSNISLQFRRNEFYAMHPHGRQYSLFRFRELDAGAGPVALYAGEVACGDCRPVYRAGPYLLYAFSYEEATGFRDSDGTNGRRGQ